MATLPQRPSASNFVQCLDEDRLTGNSIESWFADSDRRATRVRPSDRVGGGTEFAPIRSDNGNWHAAPRGEPSVRNPGRAQVHGPARTDNSVLDAPGRLAAGLPARQAHRRARRNLALRAAVLRRSWHYGTCAVAIQSDHHLRHTRGPPWRQEHDLLPTDHRTADRKVWVIGAAKGVAQSRNGKNSEKDLQKFR